MTKKKWIKYVQETSFTMRLSEGIFTKYAKEIATGKNLKPEDKSRLEQAKVELKKIFGEK